MGVNMNFLMNLIQLGLDVGILALCCEAVFRQKSEIKAKDFLIFPILLVLCVVPRVDFSVGANMTASFRSEGFEILPADNIVGLLFLIFAVLLLSSIFFGSKSSGTVFCGTMAAFSIFLFVKCLCAVLFAVCGATDILLLLGSRIAALCLIVVLEFTPLFGLIHQLVQRSDFTVLIVSANISVLLMAVLSILSFDVDRILSHLWVIIILILAVLLLDSILLFLHQRRTQEQKRIHMIEQYVPIVEELISQVRARQHEFNNRMMAIEAAVASADTLEEARKEVADLTGRRQDFNNFGGFGQQGYGYNVESLYREIGKILGLDKQHNFVIIGAGNLGRALGNYMNFERRGFIFKGMFDANPELVGKDVRGVKVMPMDQLESFIRENDIDIAVLTIPKTSAVEVADKLVANGIRAIWNFAHVDLNVPEGIQVENVHLSDSLMKLSYNINRYSSDMK